VRLEFSILVKSFVYLLLLPLNGSRARGENQGLLAWRQPDLLSNKFIVLQNMMFWGYHFFFVAPGVKYV